jgi:hypothetical protein
VKVVVAKAFGFVVNSVDRIVQLFEDVERSVYDGIGIVESQSTSTSTGQELCDQQDDESDVWSEPELDDNDMPSAATDAEVLHYIDVSYIQLAVQTSSGRLAKPSFLHKWKIPRAASCGDETSGTFRRMKMAL